jgi:NADH-quinone oxidoreductase subunit N
MLSIFCGIMGAFSEKLIKRFFVYSSMGHVGFMLLGIAASNIGYRGALDYLIIYVASSYIM